MDHLNKILAQNLKALRDENRLSLDKVAKLTGVSKSMLGQIERGEANPTISTLWKIANGLKVSFTALINQPQPETQVIRKGDIDPLTECDGKFVNYPYFPFEEGRRFEIYRIDVEEGGVLKAEPHPDGTYEFISVFDGQLTVAFGDEVYEIAEGEALKFRADRSHSYTNNGSKIIRMCMVLYYQES